MALVRQEQAEQFVQQLQQRFYLPLVRAGKLRGEELPRCCFVSAPAGGARVQSLAEDR